jgi:hypothetical protein
VSVGRLCTPSQCTDALAPALSRHAPTADAVRQYMWLFEEAVRDGVEDFLILSGAWGGGQEQKGAAACIACQCFEGRAG